jgi:hypothetical protein
MWLYPLASSPRFRTSAPALYFRANSIRPYVPPLFAGTVTSSPRSFPSLPHCYSHFIFGHAPTPPTSFPSLPHFRTRTVFPRFRTFAPALFLLFVGLPAEARRFAIGSARDASYYRGYFSAARTLFFFLNLLNQQFIS